MDQRGSIPAGGHLPTADQKLLLQTILGPKNQLIANWQRWQERVDLDDIDHGSFRLLPMLHHVLRRQGAEGKDMERYHGVARKVWYQNRLTFHRVETLIRQWQSEGREIGVLKGVALSHLYYPDPALRPMDDADVLVPQDQAVPAIDWFFGHGWKHVRGKSRDEVVSYILRKDHSIDMCHENGYNVDLHWQILNFPLPPVVMREIWDAMIPITINGVSTKTLCPTDQLLHVCAHGNAWNLVPPLRWIIDVHLILEKDFDNIDWDRVIRITEQLQIGRFIGSALSYLKEEFGEPIPPFVLERIKAIPRPPWQEEEYQAQISSQPLMMRDHSLRNRYKRLQATLPEWQAKSKFRAQIDYYKLHWELDTNAQLLGRISQRVCRRFWNKLKNLLGS